MSSPTSPKPFELTVTGASSIPHPAERALINVSVSSSGTDQASVSEDVINTAKHIESLLSPLCPISDTEEAIAAAPLAHWSKHSLSSTSHVPYNSKDPETKLPRVHNAEIRFDIRFKEFNALGSFGAKVSKLKHVEVESIDWYLTEGTERSFKAELRKLAAQDALQKARDYCEVVGCENLRPVELLEGDTRNSMSGLRSTRDGGVGVSSRRTKQTARKATGGKASGEDELGFDAQEVKMTSNVTVKFHADHAA